MENTTQQVIQIGASLIGGGAVGAIITAFVTSYRGRVQPVGKRVEVSPLFTFGLSGSAFNPSITVSDGVTDFKFSNLYVADIQIVNRGNRDLAAFTFGITFAQSDKAVHLEPYGLDRHHKAIVKTTGTPASPVHELDLELRPFNRKDSYRMKVFFVSGGSEPGVVTLGSSEPVQFTEIPSYR
jgi:hypothetical protein